LGVRKVLWAIGRKEFSGAEGTRPPWPTRRWRDRLGLLRRGWCPSD
jgi:hypothetical protein